jgi:excisionase family DNA binding protein
MGREMISTGLARYERGGHRGRAYQYKHVAEILHCSERHVIRLVQRGELRATKLSGRCTRIFDQDLDRYIEKIRGAA